MLQYITLNTSWEKLAVGDSVTFHIPNDFSYKYVITHIKPSEYYCYIDGMPNRKIFEILRIKAEEFVTSIVNYISIGDWPQVKTIDDLKKVIKALDDECIKKWGIPNKNTPQFKVGDKVKILPRNDSQADYLPSYVDNMQKYVGQLATITKVYQLSCKINLDDGHYYWPFEVLQLVTSEMDKTVYPHNLKNGDYIKITNSQFHISCIYIFKEIKNNIVYRHARIDLDNKNVDIRPSIHWTLSSSTKITYATEEEKKLLDNALLEEGYRWNNLTKQLDSIGVVDISTNNLQVQPIDLSPLYTSYVNNSIQRINDMPTDLTSFTKTETQTETELNLFPKKKHYQLNFNY